MARISSAGAFFERARIEILHILQKRAEELAVHLHFRNSQTDLNRLANYDLIVGADGINSEIRSQLQAEFKPDLSTRTNRYIWYGTRQLFDALTLTFEETGAGVFAAHSYRFNDELSTFIVECDEDTWNAAELGRKSDDETRAYLEQVFQRALGGNRLLSNNSKWLNFLLVRNRNWYANNVVLLGDALATVHFSIGSGTKLALEDAIALFHAFRSTISASAKTETSVKDRISRALELYDTERRPIVEEYQAAAWESLQFFENLKDYMHLDPVPFAYKIMTRSKRVDLENLRKRDPEFAARCAPYV